MDIIRIKELVEKGLSQRQIAKEVNRSQASVKHWLKKLGLRTKQAEGIKKCKYCQISDPFLFKEGLGKICVECEKIVNILRFRKIKQTFVDYKGGKCERCGYSKCLGSLDFHHKDPQEKDPNYRLMKNWPLKRVKAELDKCSLLCGNCHNEVHYEPFTLKCLNFGLLTTKESAI